MIQLIKIEDAKEKWDVISQFDFQKTNFLVSDTRSKFALESFLLQKQSFVTGYSVMRMSEFYKEIFQWTHPQWQVVSKYFLGELFIQFSSQHSSSFVRRIGNYETFLNYLDQFLPLLFHKEGSHLLQEWLRREGNSASLRWEHWYQICEEFFEHIKKKKIFHESGIKGFLIDQIDSLKENSFLSPRIVVDLGIYFDFCDQSILQDISQYKEVYLIAPSYIKPNFLEKEDSYSFLEKTIPKKNITTKKRAVKNETKYFSLKNATYLEEIKKAITQIRLWMESGVKPKNIAVVASHIEDQWFCLKPYLDRENIKIQKSFLADLQSFPEIRYWIARLNLHAGLESFSDLELSSFYEKPRMNFSKFKSLYYNFPKKGLNRVIYSQKIKQSEDILSGSEFVKWALSLWPSQGKEELLSLALQNFQKSLLDSELKIEQWLRYLISSIFSQDGQELVEEHSEGIMCLSLNALSSVKASHVFFLNLDEESFHSHSRTNLTKKDKESLLHELGFPLPESYWGETEAYLFWFLQSSFLKEVVLSFSEFDFVGSARNASAFWFWFKKNYCQESPLKEIKNCWDNRKNQKEISSILKIANYSEENIKHLESAFEPRKPFKNPNPLQLSFNSLQNYLKCPFIYATSKIFHIRDQEKIQTDLLPSHFGKIVHDLMTHLKSEDIEFSSEVIESFKPKNWEEYFSREEDWEVIKYKLEIIYKQVVEKEKKWRQQFPHLKIKGTEVKIQDVFWNEKKSDFSNKGEISITGSIDRIDYNFKDKEYIVLDYKASPESHLQSWVKNNKFQLLLYASILEKGLINNFEPAVIKAIIYYTYKDISFKGYVEKGSSYKSLFSHSNRSKIDVEREKLEDNFEKMNKKIQNIILKIRAGECLPQPLNEQDCQKCQRRTWCRATHLN